MKTYTTTIEKPRLVIKYDTGTESPRLWDNIGYFFTKENRYHSPDGTDHVLYHCMIDAEENATDTESHIQEIKRLALNDTLQSIVAIYPVYRYEHGNIVYKRGTAQGFDYSNCGFYIVTAESLKKIGTRNNKKAIEKMIDAELETYTKYANGEIYYFELYDEQGELIESCGNIYDLESIREALPKEWQDEDLTKYIQS